MEIQTEALPTFPGLVSVKIMPNVQKPTQVTKEGLGTLE